MADLFNILPIYWLTVIFYFKIFSFCYFPLSNLFKMAYNLKITFFFLIIRHLKYFHHFKKSHTISDYKKNPFLLVLPQILPFSFGDEPINTDDVTAVQCMVLKGDLPISVKWFLNNYPITTADDSISIVKTSTRISQLSIESVQAKHRGVYKCLAENKAGVISYSTELNVNGLLIDFFYFYF